MIEKEKIFDFVKEKLGRRCTESTIEWLKDIGYFTCPAAKSHHGNYEGGLYNHSIRVAYELQNMTDKLDLQWDTQESPWVVGLLHDICKIDDYEYDFSKSNVIIWSPKLSGHGDKSLRLLAGRFELTEEEKKCIRYHMGAFTEQKEWGEYSEAVREFPNVLYTHTADMIASQIYGV